MQYKGCLGRVTYDAEAKLFHGEVANIQDVVIFQGRNAGDLERAFQASIDDYLELCAERKAEPEALFAGCVVLYLEPELHTKGDQAVKTTGQSLYAWIVAALGRSRRGAGRHRK